MIFKLCLAFILIACFVSVSVAAETKEQVKPQQKAVEVKQDEDMVKKIKEPEKELNNTKWQISLSQITQAEKKDKFTDTLRFKDGKVEMESLISQGFSASGFTITVKGDNIIVWETMQTSEKKGLAFWKGEMEEGRMRGVLSRHFDEKTVKDYSFYSTGKETVQEEAAMAAVPPPAVAAEEVKKEDVSQGKDKKKKSDKR